MLDAPVVDADPFNKKMISGDEPAVTEDFSGFILRSRTVNITVNIIEIDGEYIIDSANVDLGIL